MNEHVAAIIVTHNRKHLLIECLDAVFAQSRPVDRVIVVDNASTDETPVLLEQSGYLGAGRVSYLRMPRNEGGAGGFYQGIKAAYQSGADWFWLMDDDTVPQPGALRNLLEPVKSLAVPVGFVCSNVQWLDQKPHRMNLPGIRPLIRGMPFNQFEGLGVLVVETCSFVSVAVSRAAVMQAGLPIREMFIWGDDVEFFSRVTSSGFFGFYSGSSVVVHKTASNANDDLLVARPEEFWKHGYGIRNELFRIRSHKGLTPFVARVMWRLIVLNGKLLCRRSDNAVPAVCVNTRATLAAFCFSPGVEKADAVP